MNKCQREISKITKILCLNSERYKRIGFKDTRILTKDGIKRFGLDFKDILKFKKSINDSLKKT